MAINFPTSLDSLTNPTTTNPLNSPSHAGQHSDENDAIEALETKVGIDGSADTNSLDYKVANRIISPASNNADYIPQWDGANSKTLKNGIPTSTFAPALGADDNYVTDAEKIKLSNLSGTNTGDEVVATGAEVDTGTDNDKMVTPKAMEDSSYAKTSAIPVKASSAEINTGTDDAKFVTPDGFSGSNFGKRIVQLKIADDATAITTGDSKLVFMIPVELNGMNLVDVEAFVSTVSSSGLPTIQIRNITDSVDMLSTKITIDASEFTSLTATTAPVIDTTKDDVATGDLLAIDIDVSGTGAKGLGVQLSFQLP